MFNHSKDKIDELYASIQAYFNIEDDGELKTYLGIDLEPLLDDSIHIMQPYLNQRILNMIPVMDTWSAKPTPAVNLT